MRRFSIYAALILLSALHISAQRYKDERLEWALHIGGLNDDRSSRRITVDDNGDAIIAGTFTGRIDIGNKTLVSTTPDFRDVFVAKVSSTGSVKWAIRVGGDDVEHINSSNIVVDNQNNVFFAFFCYSEYFTIGQNRIPAGGLQAPRIVKLNSDGEYLWSITDSHYGNIGGVPSDFVQLHVDADGNLYTGITGGGVWAIQRILKKYSPSGTLLYSYDYPHDNSHWNGDIPRVQAIATDRNKNVYTAVIYNKNVTIRRAIGDTSLNGPFDVALIRQDPNGNVQWITTITGRTRESVSHLQIRNDTLYVWGAYGIEGDSNDVVLFRDKPLKVGKHSAFVASFGLDGSAIAASRLPYNLGISNANGFGPNGVSDSSDIRAILQNDTVKIETVGNGLWVSDVVSAKQFYRGSTYSLTPVCGKHYLLGEFTDTLMIDTLDPTAFRFISRGGRDIYLAMLKPLSKYVPPKPGLRTPVNNAVDVDIPTRVDWWWVRCAQSYRYQVAKDSGMTTIVVDTTISFFQHDTVRVLEHLTKYYWRVKAITIDTFSVWSDVCSFTTVKSQPADVVLQYPGNGDQGLRSAIELRWKSSKRGTSYEVEIASDSMFTTSVVVRDTTADTTLRVDLAADAGYFWRVRAANATGTSAWSEVWRFDTRPTVPRRSVLISPLNGSQAEVINTHFVWQSQGANEGFTLQVARDSVFQTMEININLRETAWRDTLEANTTYYWRVRASNFFEAGDWSEIWSFTTGTTLDVNERTATGELHVGYVEGMLTLHVPSPMAGGSNFTLSLHDIAGRTIIAPLPIEVSNTPVRIAVQPLAHGTYFIQLSASDGKPLTGKVLVE